MSEVITIGLDLAKNVFQVHGVDDTGQTVIRRQLKRGQVVAFFKKLPPCLVGMEACATSHHWARTAQSHGHHARLLHAQYVRPYVRRNKTDAADADALLCACRDPDLKGVPVKSLDQQALQGLHRIRSQWQDTRRQRICLVRGLLAEFGISLATGASGLAARLRSVSDRLPPLLAPTIDPVIYALVRNERTSVSGVYMIR